MTNLQRAVARLVKQHGGLRLAAKAIKVDVAYLSRLRSGEKGNPGDDVMRKLGLEKAVTFRIKDAVGP